MAKVYGMLAFSCLIWGFQPACIKWLVTVWSPETMTLVRCIVASFLWFILAWRHEGRKLLPTGWIDWICIAGMGFFGIIINNIVQFAGVQYTTVTNNAIIVATGPAVTAVVSFFIIHERLSPLKWCGIFLSFVGILVVVTNGSLDVLTHFQFNKGDVYIFIAQTGWAFYSLFCLRLMDHMSVMAATFWFCFSGAIQTAAWGLFSDTLTFVPLSPLALVALCYMVFLGGFLALYLYNIGVLRAGPSKSAVFFNLTPIAGIAAGYLFYGDALSAVQIGGTIAILAGVYMTTH